MNVEHDPPGATRRVAATAWAGRWCAVRGGFPPANRYCGSSRHLTVERGTPGSRVVAASHLTERWRYATIGLHLRPRNQQGRVRVAAGRARRVSRQAVRRLLRTAGTSSSRTRMTRGRPECTQPYADERVRRVPTLMSVFRLVRVSGLPLRSAEPPSSHPSSDPSWHERSEREATGPQCDESVTVSRLARRAPGVRILKGMGPPARKCRRVLAVASVARRRATGRAAGGPART
jgi:hypothetical protein